MLLTLTSSKNKNQFSIKVTRELLLIFWIINIITLISTGIKLSRTRQNRLNFPSVVNKTNTSVSRQVYPIAFTPILTPKKIKVNLRKERKENSMRNIIISPNRIKLIEEALDFVADGTWKNRVVGYAAFAFNEVTAEN